MHFLCRLEFAKEKNVKKCLPLFHLLKFGKNIARLYLSASPRECASVKRKANFFVKAGNHA
jgi:hypothetical protein